MARLNDPPVPPVESLDALKRRFIRQNREIARVNSTQSQRIRNLEIEISRLLAENISLREQAIQAREEAERWRRRGNVGEDIVAIKGKLERRLEEVSKLVADLGALGYKRAKGRRSTGLVVPREREPLVRPTLNRAITDEDGRLPAILEDKQFPRRTLEPADFSVIVEAAAQQDGLESPDIGPPPVAHFDDNDAVGFSARRQSSDYMPMEKEQAVVVVEEEVPGLGLTVETRRRKRPSGLVVQDVQSREPESDAGTQQRQQTQAPAAASEKPAPPFLKSGAKRKLDMSELEETSRQTAAAQPDDFVFQRRQDLLNNPKKASRFTRPPGREAAQDPSGVKSASPQKAAIAGRKILAPKTTNSPAKRRVHIVEKPTDPDFAATSVPKTTVIKPTRTALAESEELLPQPSPALASLPPKTPAAASDDIMSPVSSEPSGRTRSSNEAALMASVEDVLNGSIGRGSRRSRPAVSYAEPNLRDKMRRPGKELVGAVEGIEKVSRRDGSGDEARVVKVSKESVKAEPQSDSWRQLPQANPVAIGADLDKDEQASPLRDKERKPERVKLEVAPTVELPPPPPRHDKSTRRSSRADDLDAAVERLSIFDPPSSSPVQRDTQSASTGTSGDGQAKAAPPRRRVSTTLRRHSVQPSSSTSTPEALSGTSTAAPSSSSTSTTTSAAAPTGPAPSRAKMPPRPGSAASLRGATASDKEMENRLAHSRSVSGLTSARPGGGGASTGKGAGEEKELDRAGVRAGRRRSMMV